jgi:hypothetical protein
MNTHIEVATVKARLKVLAEADEAQAITYLKSLGITGLEADNSSTGRIDFTLEGKHAYEDTVKKLTTRLGKGTQGSSASFPRTTWKLPGKGRSISVETFVEDDFCTVSLTDSQEWVVQQKEKNKGSNQRLAALKPLDRKFNPGERELLAAVFAVSNLGMGEAYVRGDKLELDIAGRKNTYPLTGNLVHSAQGIMHSLMNAFGGDAEEDDIDAEYQSWLKDLKKDTLHSLAKVHTDQADLCLYLATH